VGKKIREGRLARIPYLIVVGDAELENKTLMVRNRDTQEQKSLGVDEFISLIKNEDESKFIRTLI
jgi:threonyl-tRNA synthetase